MPTREMRCVLCARVRPFEQPPCPDGHGRDCAEWACVTCGTALLIAPVIKLTARRRRGPAVRRAA